MRTARAIRAIAVFAAVAFAAGPLWSQTVEERILRLLGMERAKFSVTRMQEDDDFSYGYGADQEIERVPFRNIDAIGPAGSINTSIRELARYVQFHIHYGKASVRVDGDGLVLEAVGIEFPLVHYHYDLFSVPHDLPASSAAAALGGAKVRFDYDNAGAINVVAVPLEPVISPTRFVRSGD